MKLPEFIYSATIHGNTSLGRNKSFPPKEDVPYEYSLMKGRFKSVLKEIKDMLGYVPSAEEAENILNKAINKTMKLEHPIRSQLENLCKAVVTGILSVPEETVLFDCELTDKIEPNNQLRILPECSEDESTYSFSDVDEIQHANDAILKRRFINALVQGVSYDLMRQTLDTDNIREWSDELMSLYQTIIILNNYLLFVKEEKISDKNPMLGAYVETHLGKGVEKTVIHSQGLVYPLLLEESFRGFFELFASHGLPKDTEKAMYIIRHADFIMAEAWDLRMGQALWEKIKYCGGDMEGSVLPYLFSSIVQLKGEEFNGLLQNILCGTKKGKKYIQNITQEVKHDEEYNKFKKDIEQFNIDKSMIMDNDEDIADDTLIEENQSKEFINSESFKNWFGDWQNDPENASFVIDNNNMPALCYHSTQHEFDEFDSSKIGSGGAGAYHGYGFNFTVLPNYTYGRYIKKAYLNARNPLSSLQKTLSVNQIASIMMTLDEGEMDSIACEFTGSYVEMGGPKYKNEVLKAAKQLYDYADDDLTIYSNLSMASVCGPQKVIDTFTSLGFDSSAEYNDDGSLRVVVVFNSNQILFPPSDINESLKKGILSEDTIGLPNIGISINCRKIDFDDLILTKHKTIETRNNKRLDKYVGQRVGLVKTGKGKAVVFAYATIGPRIDYQTEEQFYDDSRRHHITRNELYNDYHYRGKTKFGYPLLDIEPLSPPQQINKFRPVKGEYFTSRYLDTLENFKESKDRGNCILNEYLDKEYMKPLYDYLKNGDKYSSYGSYKPSERMVIPFSNGHVRN